MRALASLAAVLVAGSTVLWQATDGLRAFTADGARRVAVSQSPRVLPAALLEDQDGRRLRLADYAGDVVLVDFIYTRCPTICTRMTDTLREVAAALPRRASGNPVHLLSISFDPDHDTPAALRDYAVAQGADPRSWRFARVSDTGQLKTLLDAFGIVALPDGAGGFVHNAAVHVVDAEGRLAAILDYDDAAGIIERLEARS